MLHQLVRPPFLPTFQHASSMFQVCAVRRRVAQYSTLGGLWFAISFLFFFVMPFLCSYLTSDFLSAQLSDTKSLEVVQSRGLLSALACTGFFRCAEKNGSWFGQLHHQQLMVALALKYLNLHITLPMCALVQSLLGMLKKMYLGRQSFHRFNVFG